MAHPIQLLVTDDLERSRLTVFFRPLLATPHVLVFSVWSLAMVFVIAVAWIIALALGRVPEGLHNFIASWARYRVHLQGYVSLFADPYPPFSGAEPYPIDLEIAAANQMSRWKTFFRTILIVPAVMVSAAAFGVGATATLLGWFAALVLGRMPKELRDVGAWALRVDAQTQAYLALLTDRYPRFSPKPDADAPAGAI